MAWVPWQCVCFSVMPHLTDSSCLLPTRTSRPSTQINATRQNQSIKADRDKEEPGKHIIMAASARPCRNSRKTLRKVQDVKMSDHSVNFHLVVPHVCFLTSRGCGTSESNFKRTGR
ncbi:hypothetical protein R3I94_007808 [Phoxinus phoxinus]